jgi:hypothetical protein
MHTVVYRTWESYFQLPCISSIFLRGNLLLSVCRQSSLLIVWTFAEIFSSWPLDHPFVYSFLASSTIHALANIFNLLLSSGAFLFSCPKHSFWYCMQLYAFQISCLVVYKKILSDMFFPHARSPGYLFLKLAN